MNKPSLTRAFIQGLRESPGVFFGPAIALFRAIDRTIKGVIRKF